jgi:predicted DNA-binding transcriptional regulator AlpA
MNEIDFVRSRKETAKILSISLATLARLEKAGQMPPRIKVSDRRYGYADSAIEKFKAARTVAAA